MFYIKKLRRDVLLEPRFCGSRLIDHVKAKLTAELEGSCLGDNGYVIFILDISNSDIKPGLIDNDSGSVNIEVYFNVILLRPFMNEVVDAIAVMTSDPTGLMFKVGPLQIFVSRHNVPDDVSFDGISCDSWKSEDGTVEIVEGSIVRLRILGLTIEQGVMSAVGTIREAYLGQID